MLTARLGPAANGTPPIDPEGSPAQPPAAPASDEAVEPEPTAEQEQALAADAAEPVTVADTEPEPAVPPVEDDLDEVYDEPQPRNVRRRPFTSRLLRS